MLVSDALHEWEFDQSFSGGYWRKIEGLYSSQTFSVTLSLENWTHENFDWPSLEILSLYGSLTRDKEEGRSRLKQVCYKSSNVILTFPVVCPCRAKKVLSSSSDMAPGRSILLPKMRMGASDTCSSVSRPWKRKTETLFNTHTRTTRQKGGDQYIHLTLP